MPHGQQRTDQQGSTTPDFAIAPAQSAARVALTIESCHTGKIANPALFAYGG
ncbi:hypothetical protein ACWD25_60460 [Streptomyces sp. NPDC002920]